MNDKLVFSNFHIVLVEPAESLNIGSVARAMANLGFVNLHLVDPKNFQFKRASITACSATNVLEQVKVHQTLDLALASMQEVVGFSARRRKFETPFLSFENWGAKILEHANYNTALVFGPEESGLRQEHVSLCRWLVEIPTSTAYHSLNLSQAVLLALFEVSRKHWSTETLKREIELPTWQDFAQLDRLFIETLELSKFNKTERPDYLVAEIQNMLRRLQPERREMQILLGIFSRITKTLKHAVKPE